MKSISVHGIDENMEKAIKERAKKGGKSVNKVVRELIAKALGLGERPPDNREDFTDLCGAWSREEAVEFMETVADLDTVDEKDWR